MALGALTENVIAAYASALTTGGPVNDKLQGDGLILTHDQRLRVFVSSSMGELAGGVCGMAGPAASGR